MRRVGIAAGFAFLLAAGCAGGQSGAEGATNGERPGAGSLGPGTDGMNPGGGCTAPSESLRDTDPRDTLRMLETRHRTSLAWLPADPFANANGDDAVLEVRAHGAIERDRECGFPQVEVTATLEFEQAGRQVEFTGRAFLRGERATLNLASGRDGAEALADPYAAVRGTEGRRYRLQANITAAAVSGNLRAESSQCLVARLPADPSRCEADSQRVSWDESIGGFKLEDALAEVQAIGAQTLITSDRGRVTSVAFEVEKADGDVCAAPDARFGAGAVQVTAPVRVRARTEDGTLDVSLPARLTASADENGWLELPANSSPSGIPTRASITGRAITQAAQLGAAFAEIAPLALIDLAITTQPDGGSGEVTVMAAERKEGWPELESVDAVQLVGIEQSSCAGIDEGGRMFGGYWSYFDEGE